MFVRIDIMKLIIEFYKELDVLNLILFWGIIIVITLLLTFSIIMVNKNKKLRQIIAAKYPKKISEDEELLNEFDEKKKKKKDVRRVKEKLLKRKIYETLVENSDKVKEVLNNIKYFNQSTRQFLKDNFLRLVNKYDKDGDSFDDFELYDETDPDYQQELAKRTQLYKEYSDIRNDIINFSNFSTEISSPLS